MLHGGLCGLPAAGVRSDGMGTAPQSVVRAAGAQALRDATVWTEVGAYPLLPYSCVVLESFTVEQLLQQVPSTPAPSPSSSASASLVALPDVLDVIPVC